MSVRIVQPKTYNCLDAFAFWVSEDLKEHPHLTLAYAGTKVISRNKDYAAFLEQKILELDKQILELETDDSRNKYHFTAATVKIFELKKQLFELKRQLDIVRKKNPYKSTVVYDFAIFHKVIEAFNSKIAERIIEGQVLNLHNRLGYIRIQKIQRSHKSRMAKDWGASQAYKKELIAQGKTPKSKEHPEGENWFIFREGPYLRWSWVKNKGFSKVINHTFYGFYPAGGVNGVRKKLTEANRKDEFLSLSYKSNTL